MKKNKYILFITGDTELSETAKDSVRKITNSYEKGLVDIEVIDLIEHPQFAIEYGIIATPILIVMKPHSIEKIVGSLTDIEKVTRLLK